jgi:hypothetical protein
MRVCLSITWPLLILEVFLSIDNYLDLQITSEMISDFKDMGINRKGNFQCIIMTKSILLLEWKKIRTPGLEISSTSDTLYFIIEILFEIIGLDIYSILDDKPVIMQKFRFI